LRYHPFNGSALDSACRGTAKIVIDHLDLGPTECGQTIAHGILQRAALPVVQNLMGRRLADVENRFALQVMRATSGAPVAGVSPFDCNRCPGELTPESSDRHRQHQID